MSAKCPDYLAPGLTMALPDRACCDFTSPRKTSVASLDIAAWGTELQSWEYDNPVRSNFERTNVSSFGSYELGSAPRHVSTRRILSKERQVDEVRHSRILRRSAESAKPRHRITVSCQIVTRGQTSPTRWRSDVRLHHNASRVIRTSWKARRENGGGGLWAQRLLDMTLGMMIGRDSGRR